MKLFQVVLDGKATDKVELVDKMVVALDGLCKIQ